jgi:hypothetical protein
MARMLKNLIDGYIEWTENTEPPFSYRLATGISVIAACLKRKVSVFIGSLPFYPNFILILVGPPAARKGTAMAAGRELLNSLGVPLAHDEYSRSKLITALTSAASDGHSSLTIIATELTVFLGYQNLEMLTMLGKWYDCESNFAYDTHKHGIQFAENVWMNLLGGTTPMLLQASVPQNAIGSGFASRTIYCFEQDKAKIVYEPIMPADLREALLNDLTEVLGLYGQFDLDKHFMDYYKRWRDNSDNLDLGDPKLQGYVQRRPNHLFKLMMVCSAARSNDMKIKKEDFDKANWILNLIELKMSKTYLGIGTNPVAQLQVQIMEFIKSRGRVAMKDVYERFFSDATHHNFLDIMSSLSAQDFCKMTDDAVLIYNKDRHKEDKDESR